MLRLNVGLSRKVGETNYGSRGASVSLELESGLVNQPDHLHERIRQLFRLTREAVEEELNVRGTQGSHRMVDDDDHQHHHNHH